VRDSAGFGGNYRFFTANGRTAHIVGFEAAASYAVTPAWSFRGTLAQMSSQLDPFKLTNGNTGGGRSLANTPRTGYTLGTDFRRAATAGVFAHAEIVGRATQFDSNNQNEARRAFHLYNASFGYAWQQWTFTVWGKNLLNTRYEKRVFFFGNADPDYIETRYEARADPRQLGVSASYRF
jgi:outer membrane receptor protein involved in Fe transport